jgi:hypothetical protein
MGHGLEEINSFQLLISTSTEPGIEFLNQTIKIPFALNSLTAKSVQAGKNRTFW